MSEAKEADLVRPANRRYPEIYVGGKWRASRSSRVLRSLDPFTGEYWAEVPQGCAEDMSLAVEAAREAFDHGPWPRMSGWERARFLDRLASLVQKHGDEIARLEVRDNGKLLREMSGQMRIVPGYYRYFAGAAERIGGEVISSSKPSYFVYTVPEAVGVVAAIIPWNSPTLLLTRKLAPGLAAGCTFVVKPAEQAPVAALELARLVEEADFPPGVLNVVTGGPEAGESLVSHPGVDKVAFTGSTETGARVASAAAGHLAPTVLELGGKSANMVFADADLEAATEGTVAGIFAAAGQTCGAGSRLFVQREVYDVFVDMVVNYARSIRLGDPMSPATDMGPLAFPEQLERVLGYIDIGVREGAELAFGGRQPESLGKGLFVEPTIFLNVRNDMRIAREEIFGPVLSVIEFDDEEDVLDLANDSPYGLAGGIWTRDLQRAHRMARALRAGTVWINAYRVSGCEVPSGGWKSSGYGREGGDEGLREYLQSKAVWVELQGERRDPFKLG